MSKQHVPKLLNSLIPQNPFLAQLLLQRVRVSLSLSLCVCMCVCVRVCVCVYIRVFTIHSSLLSLLSLQLGISSERWKDLTTFPIEEYSQMIIAGYRWIPSLSLSLSLSFSRILSFFLIFFPLTFSPPQSLSFYLFLSSFSLNLYHSPAHPHAHTQSAICVIHEGGRGPHQ